MDDWKVVPIGDVAEIFDGPHATPKTVDAGPIFLGIGALENGRINLGETRHVTPADFATWTRRVKPRPRDVVFSYETRLGQVAMIPENFECCLGRRMGLVRVNQEKLDPHFFLYSYLSPQFQEFLRSRTIPGATVDRLPLKDFPSFPISLPPMDVQRSIASLLSSIDDKIELNRRMNETLEAMAQAIFRDWFVDFGPVRRKLEGATDPVAIMGGLTPDPARAAELAGSFPDGFGEDQLPAGWGEQPVIEQANWDNGAAYKKMHFVPPGEGLPVIKIAELKAGVTSTTGFTNTDLGSRYRIDDGELLFSWSGNPDTSIDTFIWTGGPAWLNQHIFAVRPNGSRTLGFLFAMLKYLNPTFAEIARDKQTTGLGHVTKEDLKRLRVVAPSKAIETAFDTLMTPIFQKLQAGLLENRTLAETRDYLLPRLMSGEIRVGEAAELVEGAA
jgi:type I restriction enzyme S subunit